MLLILLITSCSTEYELYTFNELSDANDSISEKYLKYYDKDNSIVSNYLNTYFPVGSRNGDESLVEILMSMPIEVLDSLNQLYPVPENYEEIMEETVSLSYDILVEKTSLEEVSLIYSFAMEYVETGGNSIELVEQRCQSASPIIQDCIINIAAMIDQRVIVSEHHPHANMYCVEKLVLDLVGMGVDSVIVNAVEDALLLVPGAQVISMFMLEGLDIYTIYKLTLAYNNCMIGHIS